MKKISELLQIQTHLYEMIYFYKNHKNQKKQTRNVFIIYTIHEKQPGRSFWKIGVEHFYYSHLHKSSIREGKQDESCGASAELLSYTHVRSLKD